MKLAAFKRKDPLPASVTVKLEPSDFADTWDRKPRSGAVVGLRLLSDSDESSAYGEAIRRAAESFPNDIEAASAECKRQLVIFAVARALCDPNDIAKPHPLFRCANDILPLALTTAAITRLFDTLERAQIESSPLFAEAGNAECALLCELLTDGALDNLDDSAAARVRRYLHFALTELDANGSDQDPDWSES